MDKIKKMKIVFIFLLAFTVLAACGGSTDDEGEGGGEDEKLSFKFGGQSAEDNPITDHIKDYAADVEEGTDGRIEFDIFPANQLGDYTLMYEELIRGTLDMALISIPSNFDERTEMLMLPYLINDYDQAEEMFGVDSYIFDKTKEIIAEKDVHLLGFRPLGFAGVISTKPVQEPKEFGSDKDLLVRIPQMAIYKKYGEEMGFSTTSIPWADIYSALQTGTADGVIGAQPAASFLSFGDVIKHYYEYNYSYENLALMISDKAWQKLSEEEQNLMTELGAEYTTEAFVTSEEIDQGYLSDMEEKGIEVTDFSEDELNDFAEQSREKVWPVARENIGDEIIDELLELSE